GAVVVHHLELDPGRLQRLTGETCGEDGLGRGAATGRVRQRLDAETPQQVQDARSAGRVQPPHRHRGELGARGDQSPLQRGEAGRATRSHDQARAELPPGDDQRIVHEAHPPCTAVRISTTAPSDTIVWSHSVRGTTAPLTATATPVDGAPTALRTPATVVPASRTWVRPLTTALMVVSLLFTTGP